MHLILFLNAIYKIRQPQNHTSEYFFHTKKTFDHMRHLLSHGASKTHNLSFFHIEKYAFHTMQAFFHTNFYQAQNHSCHTIQELIHCTFRHWNTSPGYSTTNLPIESFNNVIKRESFSFFFFKQTF
jgi:hypothetical protein